MLTNLYTYLNALFRGLSTCMFNFSNQFSDALTIFFGIIVQAIPFLLLGVLVSAILAHFVKEEFLLKLIPKNRFAAILVACALGFMFPVCECGNVPVARRLIQKGVSPSVALTFLLSAPALNPVVIFVTWAAFQHQPEVLWFRILFTFLIAGGIGLLFSYHPHPEIMLVKNDFFHKEAKTCDCFHGKKSSKFFGFLKTVLHEFLEMLSILAFGAFLASMFQVLLPRDLLLIIGKGPILSVIVMVVFAFLLSVCANVDAFIALSYSNLFTVGSLVAFLTFGPMIDLKSLFMFKTTFTWRTVGFVALLVLLLTLLLCFGLNIFVY